MMGNIFVTSDLHFGHITLQQSLREFESDELIIENWNKQVKNKHDRIYVLGDFCMEKPRIIREVLPRLKGEIILIGGNHDSISCSREWIRQGVPVIGCMRLFNLLFTHIPVRITEFTCGIKGNVHGHIHVSGNIHDEYGNILKYDPEQLDDPRYYNVNVEFHDYKLVPIEDILKHFKNNENKQE